MTGEWIAKHSSRFMRFMGFMKVHEVRFRVRRASFNPMNLMNPMNRLVLVVSFLLPLAQAGPTSVSYPAKAGPGAGKRVVFLAGDEEYRSEEGLPMLAKILSQRHGFKCTVLFSVGRGRHDQSQEQPPRSRIRAALDSADAIVMLLRFRSWPDEDMARFDARAQRRHADRRAADQHACLQRLPEGQPLGVVELQQRTADSASACSARPG